MSKSPVQGRADRVKLPFVYHIKLQSKNFRNAYNSKICVDYMKRGFLSSMPVYKQHFPSCEVLA